MAPNPSAALRVLLTALIAAGTVPVRAFAEVPPTKDEPGSSFIVLRVGAVVPTYGSVMIRADQLKGIKPGEEREVEALFPKSMSNLGRANVFGFSVPYSANHYQVNAESEEVKVKMSGTASSPRWGLARGGVYLKDGDKEAAYTACIPNGDQRCFDAIRGVARRFDVVATAAPARPAPQPPAGSQPHPRPAPPAPNAPAGDFAGPFPWRSAPINDTSTGVEHRKCKKEECSCSGDACKGKRINLYAVTKADKAGETLTLTMALDPDNYLTNAGGKWNMCWNSGNRASVPVATMAGFADAKFLPDATYWVKGSNKGGDFKGAKKAEFSWTGSAPPKPKDMSPECAYGDGSGAPADTAPDAATAAKLKDLLGDDKAAMILARLAQKVWAGSPSFDEAVAAALKNPDKAKGKAEFLGKAQAQVLADLTKSATALKADAPLKDDFKEAYCKPAGAPAPAPVQKTDTAMAEAKAQTTDTNRIDGRGTAAVPVGAGSPYAGLCSLLEDAPAAQPPASGPRAEVPPITGERPAVSPDKAAADTSAEDAKKKKDLQRMAIGGMGGALVLGVFGFIFGGPIGAIAMGAIGFGLMAGVTYLNNNPIDK